MKELELVDALTILSFILQVENNEELEKQSTNDEIQNNLHNDVMLLLKDNRRLFNVVIKQNEEILKKLEKGSSLNE